MYLALLIRILDDLATARVHLDERAIGQPRLFAAVRINKLAYLVGEDDLARFIRVMLFDLTIGKLEYLQAVRVDYLRYVGLCIEISLRARVMIHFFAVTVKKADKRVPLVSTALFSGAIGEHGHCGSVLEQLVHMLVVVVARLFDLELTLAAAYHGGHVLFSVGRHTAAVGAAASTTTAATVFLFVFINMLLHGSGRWQGGHGRWRRPHRRVRVGHGLVRYIV